MRRPARIVLVVMGLAAVVYGVASLTGGWLGTPPWQEQADEEEWGFTVEARQAGASIPSPYWNMGISWGDRALQAERDEVYRSEAKGIQCDGITGGVVALGLGLIAVAWSRRRRPAPAA